jgi:hypothetical protein
LAHEKRTERAADGRDDQGPLTIYQVKIADQDEDRETKTLLAKNVHRGTCWKTAR